MGNSQFPGDRDLDQKLQQMGRIADVGLLLAPSLPGSAPSPIQSSCPNSARIRSNQRVFPVASMPTLTGPLRCE